MRKKAIAIITARGGSKRIPRKNIKEFCGKPIISYSIEAAIESGVFDEVMVSTDDEEIAEIAKKYGAKIPFIRSEATSNDFATTADVIKEVVECYEDLNYDFKYICCIYPTAPFVTAEKLKKAIELLEESEVESVMPVTTFSFPPMRGMYIDDGNLNYVYPEYSKMRSQDIKPMYHDCGQFYCINKEAFMESGKLVMNNTKPIIVDEMEVQDIDTESDWKLAEIKYKYMVSRGL